MAQPSPIVYLVHGDDEFAIAQTIASIEKKLGDSTAVEMNVTRLDGRTLDLEGWFATASTMPFLAKRRLVVITNPKVRFNNQVQRERFILQLEQLPSTTALVLVENQLLVDDHEKKDWLLKWAKSAGERAHIYPHVLPKGEAMAHWVLDRAKRLGGQFTQEAARKLASLIDDDPRLADQEIQKALTYTNYKRPVDADDIELLTPDSAGGDIFGLVDLMADQDGRKALGMLERLLDESEPLSIFAMIVRQFRLLILARELYDNGAGESQVVDALKAFKQQKIAAYPAKKAYRQAQRFTLPFLEAIYRRLLALDEAMKSSQMPPELALEVFVASFTNQPVPARR